MHESLHVTVKMHINRLQFCTFIFAVLVPQKFATYALWLAYWLFYLCEK